MEAWHMRRWRERYVEEGYNGLLDPASGQALLRIHQRCRLSSSPGRLGVIFRPDVTFACLAAYLTNGAGTPIDWSKLWKQRLPNTR